MEFSKSQQLLLQRLKTRGPQSVKILAKQLNMTTMGARQHLADLLAKGYVSQTQESRQNRGRPVHLWKLTESGHRQFPDAHATVVLDLIAITRSKHGEDGLNQLVDQRSDTIATAYREALDSAPDSVSARIEKLAELRTQAGFMAEIRLLPDGWLFIENHCPVYAAAQACRQFCSSELRMYQSLFAADASVEQVDHVLTGARRCAFKFTPLTTP